MLSHIFSTQYIKSRCDFFTFLFTDLFDTIGTLVGVANQADLLTDDGSVVNIKSNISKNQGLFTGAGISTPVVYNTIMKTFIPSGTVNEYSAFLGWILNTDNSQDLIDVLYRGFLFKEPLQFPATLKPLFIQSYIAGEFEKIKQAIKENMPRIKRLKRINLKMITKEHALMLYYHLDDFIARYQSIYDYAEA